ncbi:MAG: hypothetical protein HQK54_08050 [Oligoflexales bacterium]|nr:hypothetical protein [Oligoflexales bacterium]
MNRITVLIVLFHFSSIAEAQNNNTVSSSASSGEASRTIPIENIQMGERPSDEDAVKKSQILLQAMIAKDFLEWQLGRGKLKRPSEP